MKNSTMNRRRFMRNMVLGTSAVYASTGVHGMQFFDTAVADVDDYKALVCIFLFGGNDSYNMLTPLYGQARVDYENIRDNLSRPLGLEIFPQDRNINGGLGFDVEMQALKSLFDQGKLAIQGNVGPLVEPILDAEGLIMPNKTQPKGLYAHDASQQNWMRGADLAQRATGWGGRMLDSVVPENTSSQSFMHNISLAGSNFWQSGNTHGPYSVPRSGKIENAFLDHGHASWIRENAINNLRKTQQSEHILRTAFTGLFNNAIDNNQSLVEQLANVNDSDSIFPDYNLAQDLKSVAKMIEVGRNNGLKRQVFFVGMGGFDTHNGQAEKHPHLLAQLSESMSAFYNYTTEKGLENNITSFTMSEFGRSLRSNGRGTDHGWAGHQFILGGAVNGGRIYGDMPAQNADNNLIPTTSNEQMFASLAKWYGVNDDEKLKEIFPNLKNFSSSINYFGNNIT